ncbi:universal stress protein [Marinospirillum alkaliphilum]|uniref:Nucleotide-binding universal stress protein, UspA family n=1 Tax=Marinospirillum alkaliphilum DSM 21637 TaxID=1122209 RepID=A0A1K1XLZ7_9GAMM|nr:universal stress protein [Marinospirillum alkaliphilum]SFX50623.1 Nucleotide-binding universal stress protein, UspA family [Marinospirillum alkaliphilum DSM 21637]
MFKHILLPVDISDGKQSEKAIRAAVELAQMHQAQLHVLTVLPGFGSPIVASYFPKQDLKKLLESIYQKLQELVEPFIPDALEVKLRAVEGTPHKEILKEAKRIKADLIVIPSHDPKAVERFFLGSVAARVVERAHVSVMVIRPDR